jgi:hypothetical protein
MSSSAVCATTQDHPLDHYCTVRSMTSRSAGAGRPRGQGCGQLPLALPCFTPFTRAGDLPADLAGKCGGDLVAGAEAHVVGLLDRPEVSWVLSEPGGTGAQHQARPG